MYQEKKEVLFNFSSLSAKSLHDEFLELNFFGLLETIYTYLIKKIFKIDFNYLRIKKFEGN